jgi:hypothetical protein
MGEIDLRGQLANLTDNQEFIACLCRFAEGIMTQTAVKKKFRLDESTWSALGDDDALIQAVEDEKVRRIRDGSAKREKAQKLVVAAPDVLSGILLDDTANARHRIDSCKVLNDLAANGPGDTAPTADRFIIQINLGADTLTFNKSIRALEPNEVDPDDVGPDTVQGMIAAIAMKNPTENGGGESL